MRGAVSTAVSIAAVMAVELLAVPAAFAQRPEPYTRTGSRIAKDPETLGSGPARQIVKDMARCVHRRNPELAERFLKASDPRTVDYESLGFVAGEAPRILDMEKCKGETRLGYELRSMMRMSTPLFRMALAEESYLARNSRPITISEDSEEILSNRYFVLDADIEQKRALGAFADCTVFHAPAEADRLLRTTPGSQQEVAAAQALVPALSQCLVEGQEVALDVKGIREFAADGLWSRSVYQSQLVTEGAE